MPMPELDPSRFVPVVPVDAEHKIPRSAAEPKRFFSQDPASPDTADTFDPYVAQLLAGGSLRRACDVGTAAAKEAAAKAEVEVKAAADKAAMDAKATADKPLTPPTPAIPKADATKLDKPAA